MKTVRLARAIGTTQDLYHRARRSSRLVLVRDMMTAWHVDPHTRYINNLEIAASLRYGSTSRPHYTLGVLYAAFSAKAHGVHRITVVEFGVHQGDGLRALEVAAEVAKEAVDIDVHVLGVDTGSGLPAVNGWQDHPELFQEGDYCNTRPVTSGAVIRGDVRDLRGPLAAATSPIGFVSLDMDYFSSTESALALLAHPSSELMPRVWTYIDDCVGLTFSKNAGALAAVEEFNRRHGGDLFIARIPGFQHELAPRLKHYPMADKFFLLHSPAHPAYCHAEQWARP